MTKIKDKSREILSPRDRLLQIQIFICDALEMHKTLMAWTAAAGLLEKWHEGISDRCACDPESIELGEAYPVWI